MVLANAGHASGKGAPQGAVHDASQSGYLVTKAYAACTQIYAAALVYAAPPYKATLARQLAFAHMGAGNLDRCCNLSHMMTVDCRVGNEQGNCNTCGMIACVLEAWSPYVYGVSGPKGPTGTSGNTNV